MAVSQADVNHWLADNPNATPDQIYLAAQQYGVTGNMIDQGMGLGAGTATNYAGQRGWQPLTGTVVNQPQQPNIDTATGAVTEYIYPEAINQLVDTTANYAGSLPQFAQDVYSNWYDQPLSTGTTPYQQQAWSAAMANPQQQWLSPLQQASSLYSSSANYDPNKLRQYLNPYTEQAADATMSQVNRNLMENILPNVNSTFAGTGQFGSSRNADFTNRAIRDTQTGLAETLAKQNVSNWQQAQQDYLNWSKNNQTAASGLQGVAGTGSTIEQTGLTNMMTAAQAQQAQEQSTLDKAYQDYLTRQQFPLTAVGALSTATKNIGSTIQPNKVEPVSQPDDISRVLAAIQAMQAGLTDTTTQSLLNTLLPGTFS